jgi:hypothetical protein
LIILCDAAAPGSLHYLQLTVGLDLQSGTLGHPTIKSYSSPSDRLQVRYVLKNLARDWSAEGAYERSQSYGRIVEELKLRFKDW